MKVVINPDGITAREVNSIPKPVAGYYDNYDSYDEVAWEMDKNEWQEAEKNLKTYEIEDTTNWAFDSLPMISKLRLGSIHDAELIEGTNKVKIRQ